jgi:hypothetical protein
MVQQMAIFIQPATAMVAEAGAEMVLLTAAPASVGQLAGGHGQEQAVVPIDQLHVADDEGVIERKRAIGFETISFPVAEIDANFRQLHKTPVVEDPVEQK